jgi:hypothetical protein
MAIGRDPDVLEQWPDAVTRRPLLIDARYELLNHPDCRAQHG